MKQLIATSILLLVLAVPFVATAQSKTITISGKVTSFEESLPLEAVSIQARESKIGTGTLADGSFSLPVSSTEKTLVVSLDGYEKVEVPVTNKREYVIVLKRLNNLSGERPVFLLTRMAK